MFYYLTIIISLLTFPIKFTFSYFYISLLVLFLSFKILSQLLVIFFNFSYLIPVSNYLYKVNNRVYDNIRNMLKINNKTTSDTTSIIIQLPVLSLVTLSISPQCTLVDYYKLWACICSLRIRCSIHSRKRNFVISYVNKTWFLHALCN